MTSAANAHPLLQKLLTLKAVLWLLCALSVGAAHIIWQLHLPLAAMERVLAVGFLVIAAWALRLGSKIPLSSLEIAALLLSDMAQIAYLIYLSGGSSNPFTSSLLVPIAVSAALLPRYLSAGLTLVALGLYGIWVWQGDVSQPMAGMAHMHTMEHSAQAVPFSLHLLGMWLNFVASAILLWIFIAAIADALKKREAALRKTREKLLQNEQLIGVANLTANTAHALGTPLNSMALILDDAAHSRLSSEDLILLKQQLNICKGYLTQLKLTPLLQASSQFTAVSLNHIRDNLLQHYHLVKPGAPLDLGLLPAELAEVKTPADSSLLLAVINLIDNSLEAASCTVSLEWQANAEHIILAIRDDGPGINADIAEDVGKPFVSNKTGGLGLGVFLSHATLERYGASVVLTANQPKGTLTQIFLPRAH